MIKILFTLLFVFNSLLQASYYVQVMKTKYYDDVLLEELNMNVLGFNTIVSKVKRDYVVYTGPYKSAKEAKRALSFTKEYYDKAFIIKKQQQKRRSNKLHIVSGIDNTSVIKTKKKVVVPMKEKSLKLKELNQKALSAEELQEKKSSVEELAESNVTTEEELLDLQEDSNETLFIAFSAGYSYYDIKIDNPKSIEFSSPSSVASSYSFEVGYVDENWMNTLVYNRSANSDFSVNDYYFTINYLPYKGEYFTPYAGFIAGYEKMNFKTDILATGSKFKRDGYSFIMGAQVGLMFKIYEHISLYNAYKMFMTNNRTVITKEDNSGMLLYGMKYSNELGINISF